MKKNLKQFKTLTLPFRLNFSTLGNGRNLALILVAPFWDTFQYEIFPLYRSYEFIRRFRPTLNYYHYLYIHYSQYTCRIIIFFLSFKDYNNSHLSLKQDKKENGKTYWGTKKRSRNVDSCGRQVAEEAIFRLNIKTISNASISHL